MLLIITHKVWKRGDTMTAKLDRVRRKQKRRGAFKRQLPLHMMLIVPIVLIIIYKYIPMGGLYIAFQKFNPALGMFGAQKWIGLRNFEYIFRLPGFRQAFGNTLVIAALKIVSGLVVPVVLALLLNEVSRNKIKKTVQTLVYMPHFLSWIILSGVLIDILSPNTGIVNRVLTSFGMKPIFFLGDNKWFRFTLVVTNIWKESGFQTIVYLAAITSIDPTLYEAAIADGANRFQQTIHITLPGIAMVVVLLTVLSLGNVLNAGFDQVLNLYSAQVYETGDIIDTMVYRVGLINAKFGVATAIGLFKSVVSLVLISVSYFIAYKFANYRIF